MRLAQWSHVLPAPAAVAVVATVVAAAVAVTAAVLAVDAPAAAVAAAVTAAVLAAAVDALAAVAAVVTAVAVAATKLLFKFGDEFPSQSRALGPFFYRSIEAAITFRRRDVCGGGPASPCHKARSAKFALTWQPSPFARG